MEPSSDFLFDTKLFNIKKFLHKHLDSYCFMSYIKVNIQQKLNIQGDSEDTTKPHRFSKLINYSSVPEFVQ